MHRERPRNFQCGQSQPHRPEAYSVTVRVAPSGLVSRHCRETRGSVGVTPSIR